MAIRKEEKIKIVDNLIEKLAKIKIAILINYSGLNTEQLFNLREKLEEKESELKVIKNNLIQKALKSAKIEIDPDIIKGPIALIFSFSNELEPTKIVYQFSKIEEKPQILGGIYKNEFIDTEMIEKLAKIPERPVLEAQLVGSIAAPISKLVYSLKGNLYSLVSILSQVSQQKTVNS